MSIDRELEMILYSTPESDVTVSAIIKDETLWLNQKSLAELFNVDISTINQHLKNIGSVKNVGVEDTPRISEPLSFFEKTLFSSAPTGVSHR